MRCNIFVSMRNKYWQSENINILLIHLPIYLWKFNIFKYNAFCLKYLNAHCNLLNDERHKEYIPNQQDSMSDMIFNIYHEI